MSVSRRAFLGAVPTALAAQPNSAKLDRRALVTRHNPTLRVFDPRAPLSVGNGEFAIRVLQVCITQIDKDVVLRSRMSILI